MGYTTDFEGEFEITPILKDEDRIFLTKFADTRRMARKGLDKQKYGTEGEFYVDGGGDFGQDHESSIINYNQPPSTQPGLWCKWAPNNDGTALTWNGAEKFYYYTEWLEYLVEKILKPRGYSLNGEVSWKGEDSDDIGLIIVENNNVSTKAGKVVYE